MKVTINDYSSKVMAAVDEAIELALENIARTLEHHAREDYVPVDTGRLKNSITHDKTKTVVYTDVEYAGYVEFGTSKMEARHYMKRAGDNHKDEYLDILKKHLSKY